MTAMIYFVDEDITKAWAETLEIRGHSTKIIRNADVAYDQLHNCRDAMLVFIDVMLACSPVKEERRYSSEETDAYKSTGLELLQELIDCNPEVFPCRAIILSQAAQGRILNKIERLSNSLSVPFWRKIQFGNPYEFALEVERHIIKLEQAETSE